jgi:plastocyanin
MSKRRQIFAVSAFAAFAIVAALTLYACDEKKTETAPGAAGNPSGATPSGGVPPAGPAVAASGAATAPSGAAAAPSGAAAAPSSDKGTVKGSVVLSGKVPEMPDQKRQTDAFCAKSPQKDDEVVVGKGGALANVLVHINGLPATPPPSKAAELNQDKCSYAPRVQGIVVGQTLSIQNSDPVLHNVREIKGALTKKNFAQVPGTPAVQETFSDAGTLWKFKCDIHNWMTAYVWVQSNGAFAVSDKDGKFEIKDVPVGTWDVTAWHERFGEKNAKITVAKDKTAELKLVLESK